MAAPVLGSASAATSFCVRFRQPVVAFASALCQEGLTSSVEQPEPVSAQAVSAQCRVLTELRTRLVPPTDVTYGRSPGKDRPYPVTRDGATMATPGWLK